MHRWLHRFGCASRRRVHVTSPARSERAHRRRRSVSRVQATIAARRPPATTGSVLTSRCESASVKRRRVHITSPSRSERVHRRLRSDRPAPIGCAPRRTSAAHGSGSGRPAGSQACTQQPHRSRAFCYSDLCIHTSGRHELRCVASINSCARLAIKLPLAFCIGCVEVV